MIENMRDQEEDDQNSASSNSSEEEITEELEKEEEGSKKRVSDVPANPKHLSKKLKRNELYKPPTVDELNNLKEAEALFHSSLFRLQIDELMSEVKLQIPPELQNFIKTVKSFIKSLPPSSEWFEVNDRSWIKNYVKVPFIRHCRVKNALFKFIPPNDMFETGSYAIDALHSSHPVIDLGVIIPLECWRKGDHLNQIYHHKRALYLTYIAKHIKDQSFVKKIEYEYQDECALKPALLIKSKKLNGVSYTIRLLPCPETGFVKQGKSRFHPGMNNVRFSSFYHQKEKDVKDDLMPTPFYNSTILADLMMLELTKFLRDNISSQSVKDAIILAKIWSGQRGLMNGPTSLNGFTILMIIIHLLHKKKISPMMSSYQIFRNFLLFLSHDFELGMSLCTEKEEKQPEFCDFQKAFDVVILDPSGFMNLCYNMSKESLRMCCHEANLALKILDGSQSDSFFLLFIDRIPFCRKFDYLFHIGNVKKFAECGDSMNLHQNIMDHVKDLIPAVTPKLCDVVEKALGSRVKLISFEASPLSPWSVTETYSHPYVHRHVTLGLVVNQETAFSNVEKGPPFDDAKARDFRDFWGEKSELRRFQDGSMHETVVWPAETIEEQRHVIPHMVKYILGKHAKIDADDIICRGNDLNFVLNIPKNFSSPSVYGTGEQTFVKLMQSFNVLTKELRKLEGLPLVISSIQGLHAAFRFCDVFPPIARTRPLPLSTCSISGNVMIVNVESGRCPPWIPPLPVIIHFEGSGKWPDDKDAIRRIKAAMLIKLAQLLKSQLSLVCKATPSYVDVLKDGYVFRLEIACRKEITLLRQFVTPDGMVKIKESKAAQNLEYRNEILPKLNSFLHGLHQQHNSFGTACRLAKRFISSQLLHGYLDDVLIELLMAFIYIRPDPYTCPCLPQIAFQRFLSLLNSHNWDVSPLFVNFNNELNKQDLEEIQSTFSSQRSTLPPMVVVTPMDRSGTLFTRETPSQMILKRLTVVSKTALEFLEEKLCNPCEDEFEDFFKPPLHPYDVLIHLKPEQIPKRAYGIMKDQKNTAMQKDQKIVQISKMPVVGYDPVDCYLQELKAVFGELALFFYDIYGGRYIAVLWNREAFKSKPFKVSHINCHKIERGSGNSDEAVMIVPNVEAMVTDFMEMGTGLVDRIEKHTENWDFS